MRCFCSAVLVLLSAAGLSACVPAGSPGGGSQVAPRAQPLAAGAFPEPLRGWTASAPSSGPGQGGGTVARRTYQNPAGRTVEVIWYLDDPSRAATVKSRANTETGDSGLAMVLGTGDESIEVATDARTVLRLDGNAGLGAQMSYFAAIIGAAPPSS